MDIYCFCKSQYVLVLFQPCDLLWLSLVFYVIKLCISPCLFLRPLSCLNLMRGGETTSGHLGALVNCQWESVWQYFTEMPAYGQPAVWALQEEKGYCFPIRCYFNTAKGMSVLGITQVVQDWQSWHESYFTLIKVVVVKLWCRIPVNALAGNDCRHALGNAILHNRE